MAKYTASIVMEFIWLILGITLIIMALQISFTKKFSDVSQYFALSAISFLMYLNRRRLRLKKQQKGK